MEATTTIANDVRKTRIIDALHRFIGQRPRLEYGNYGDPTAYRREMRSISRDGREARILLGAIAWRDSITADAIIEGANSGRLSITETDKGVRIDYCTGQYWPTEYRRAVAALCANLLWRDRIDNALEGRYSVGSGDKARAQFRREFGRGLASRWFN